MSVQVIDITTNPNLQAMPNKDFLSQQYQVEGVTISHLQKKTGLSKTALKDRIRRFDIWRPQNDSILRGHVPYGKKIWNGRLIDHKKELHVLLRIIELRNKGYSLRRISKILDDEGVPTKQGGKWQAATVLGILRRNPVL